MAAWGTRALPVARAGMLGLIAIAGHVALRAADASASTGPRTIALIGGPGREAPGRHDYAAGIEEMATWLQAWSAAQRGPSAQRLRVLRFPQGWPQDDRALQAAHTVLLYADGDQRHPLRDAARRQRFEALMRQGVGLVALHQASTVPADGQDLPLAHWLGAERRGLFDRSTETVTLEPQGQHPVARGVAPFTYRDEFYPTLRFQPQGVTPVLSATLRVQYRAGRAVVEDLPERRIVAWAYQRPGGGRSFGYTGVHELSALRQPMLRQTLLNALLWTAGIEPGEGRADVQPSGSGASADAANKLRTPNAASPHDVTTFHANVARSGWHARETTLTPAAVAAPDFGLRWQSPPFDTVDGMPPRLYASPLYLHRLAVTAGPLQGQVFSAVLAASSNGEVRAINARQAGDVAPGRVLWSTRLAAPCRLQPAPLDGVATGVLSTPVIDVARQRLYLTHCDADQRWQAYALDLGSGAVLPGWPLRLDEPGLNAVNRNAGPEPVPPKRRFDFRVQRGALNLSPDGARLYVVFGETETGWLVSVDTAQARIHSAFAASAMPHRGSGGIWGAGGPAVDELGRLHVVTGSGFDGYKDQPHDWTQSLLQLSDERGHGLRLVGSYTPFNHCRSAKMDIDLGSGGALLLPGQPGSEPLLVIGGKQGNAYLLPRDRLPGRLDRRPACSADAASDVSLLPPGRQPQFIGRGPLNVFGPYSEEDAALDTARARSLPAAFRGADGRLSVLMTGNTRAALGSPQALPPSLVRLDVDGEGTPQAHLRVAQANMAVVFGNPGSPVVSSDGPRGAVVWVLDENARRSAPLQGAGAPSPVLYAFDAHSLQRLWQSPAGLLHTSGKYNEPLVAQGQVIVGTDRLQAFGPGADPKDQVARISPASAAVPAPAAPTATSGTAVSPADAATLYAQRCAVCHDQPQGNIPPRSLLAQRPPARIIDALRHGVMQPQAAGLSAAQIQALARYLGTPQAATP